MVFRNKNQEESGEENLKRIPAGTLGGILHRIPGYISVGIPGVFPAGVFVVISARIPSQVYFTLELFLTEIGILGEMLEITPENPRTNCNRNPRKNRTQ